MEYFMEILYELNSERERERERWKALLCSTEKRVAFCKVC